jgi:hypothetical protein
LMSPSPYVRAASAGIVYGASGSGVGLGGGGMVGDGVGVSNAPGGVGRGRVSVALSAVGERVAVSVGDGVAVRAGSVDRGVGEGVSGGAPTQAASSAPLSRIGASADRCRFVCPVEENRVSIPLIIIRDRAGG